MDEFRIGGWGMYLTLACGAPLVLTSLRYAMTPHRRWVPLLLSLGVLTLASGSLGFITGLIRSLTYLDQVGADRRWIALLGLGESLYNVAFALLFVVVGALATCVGAWRLSQPGWLAQPAR